MPTDTPNPKPTAPQVQLEEELLKAALDSHKAITLKALDVIPEGHRLTVYILWTLSALGAIAGLVFLIRQEPTFGFVIILATFAAIVAAIILQNRAVKKSPDQFGRLVKGQVSGPTWARCVPNVPIEPQAKLDEFQVSLRQLRTTAWAKLNEIRKKSRNAEIDQARVRANLFLVHSEKMKESGALVLIIPRRLHDNMQDFRDRDIQILPHEGVTGRTFTLGEPCGATAELRDGRLIWSRVDLFPERPSSDEWGRFTLSEEQNKLIGTRLRWIISFPLRYPGEGTDKTFAVLNIDGMDDDLPVDDMRHLAREIEAGIKAFAASMAALPKARITIRVEAVP